MGIGASGRRIGRVRCGDRGLASGRSIGRVRCGDRG